MNSVMRVTLPLNMIALHCLRHRSVASEGGLWHTGIGLSCLLSVSHDGTQLQWIQPAAYHHDRPQEDYQGQRRYAKGPLTIYLLS